MNVSDSERIAGFLEAQNWQKATSPEKADLVIFNTCGIRQMAENRAYSAVHALWKKQTATKIALTGCLAKRPDVQRRLKEKVALFFAIDDLPRIEALLLKSQNNTNNKNITCHTQNYLEIRPKHSKLHTASVPIMTGCNNFCSYCVVPYARGREISRPAEKIITEVRQLIKAGYKEIILLGQNVNSYRFLNKKSPDTPKITFPQLLREIEKIPGHFWIRFVSSHPKDFSAELIETITHSKKICEQVHLPLQAGADEILSKMNRHYSATDYLNLVEKIKTGFRKQKPDMLLSLTSDIIVGFPGETEEHFQQSARLMKLVNYDLVYFGRFSPRPGTAAWEMPDDVPQTEKIRREKILNTILAKTTLANNRKYRGKILEVLVDEEKISTSSKTKELVYFGRTRSGKNVKLKTDKKNLTGKFIAIKITKIHTWNLEGETE